MKSIAAIKISLPKKLFGTGTYTAAMAFLITSTIAFSFMSAFVRMAGDLPTLQKAFFRNLVSVAVSITMLYKGGAGFKIQRRNLLPIFVRAVSGTIALAAGYYAFDHMLIADATILAKIAPFFTMMFSAWLMKEKVGVLEWGVLGIVFLGSTLVIKPSFDFVAMTPAIIATFGGICTGISVTMVRFLQIRGEKSETIVLVFSLFSCLLFLPVLIFDYVPMSFAQFSCLMAAGASATVGQFTMSAAYKRAPSSVLSVFEYSQVLFTAILGAVLFMQYPDILSFAGYFVVIAASVMMAIHGKKKEALQTDAS